MMNDDNDERRRTNHTTIKYINKCECPRLKRGPYHYITIAPYPTPQGISHTKYNIPHVPYPISRAT